LEGREIPLDLAERLCEGPWHPSRDPMSLMVLTHEIVEPLTAKPMGLEQELDPRLVDDTHAILERVSLGKELDPRRVRDLQHRLERTSMASKLNLPRLRDIRAILERLCHFCAQYQVTPDAVLGSLGRMIRRIEGVDADAPVESNEA
jgi:hypothetical protein